MAKTLVVYKLANKKHAFVTSADARKGLSHIAVQILFYNPAHPVATPAQNSSSNELTFSLLDATDVVYVFQRSPFKEVGEGCYMIPAVIRDMLGSVHLERLIDRYYDELGKLKSQPSHGDISD